MRIVVFVTQFDFFHPYFIGKNNKYSPMVIAIRGNCLNLPMKPMQTSAGIHETDEEIMEAPFINIHTHTTKSGENLIQIINMDLNQPCPEQGYYSYGIHPWALDKTDFQIEEALALLEERLQSLSVLALGEAGVDKMHKESFERQIELFERQIELSEALQKPMIMHNVRSHNEILALRKKHKAKQPWILHGFNGTEQDIQQLTGQGLYFSVGESLLHSERKITKSLNHIPLDFLFLETDMAEIGIETVYETAARLLEMELSELKTKIFSNFAALWNTGKIEPAC